MLSFGDMKEVLDVYRICHGGLKQLVSDLIAFATPGSPYVALQEELNRHVCLLNQNATSRILGDMISSLPYLQGYLKIWAQTRDTVMRFKAVAASNSGPTELTLVLDNIDQKLLSLDPMITSLSLSSSTIPVETIFQSLSITPQSSSSDRDSLRRKLQQILTNISTSDIIEDSSFTLVLPLIEDKVASNTPITRTQMKVLRTSLSTDYPDLMITLSDKLMSLGLAPSDTDTEVDDSLSHQCSAGAMDSLISLTSLCVDHAIQLLIFLGSDNDLHDRVTLFQSPTDKPVDGRFIAGITQVEQLMLLENTQRETRKQELERVLSRVRVLADGGIPTVIMDSITRQLQQRQLAISNRHRFKATDGTLQGAVDAWCSDRVGAYKVYGHISDWDTSAVTQLNRTFANKDTFNDNINQWDMSNVTSMFNVFDYAGEFNQPLNNWNVSNVTHMQALFCRAYKFNQPLDRWNMSKVKCIDDMFFCCDEFNQPLDMWDVSNVTSMSWTFYNCEKFNQPLNRWNVSKVTWFYKMFEKAKCFNQPLDRWNTCSAENMQDMFQDAIVFNQRLDNWNVSKIKTMSGMFSGAKRFPHVEELKKKWPKLYW